ncbi:golgin subfamily A member 2-like [Anopheles albimanus]|uniref:golgin subfamily A member 2-like n=1 Tax=Anopheles albimanus TaxID=7167 RepID=UPI00163FEBF0|nr:golgin subfamily A member 2-like [Anopheles albimanus]
MADNKAEKIAAARIKLKQYQTRRKDRTETEANQTEEEPTPPDRPVFSEPPTSSAALSTTNEVAAYLLPTNQRPEPDNPYRTPAVDASTTNLSHYFTATTSNDGPAEYPFGNQLSSSGGAAAAGVGELFGAAEPQIAPMAMPSSGFPVGTREPAAVPVDANVYSISKISDEIGNLIANANADLGPQNTILELESEKADLGRQLNAEKLENDELRLRLRNNQSLVDELQIEIDRLRVENSTRVTVELGPLQEQLQLQIQAVGVLVGEKAELTSSLAKCQSLVKERTVACEEMHSRLVASESTVKQLTRQLEEVRSEGQRYERLEETIGAQVAEYQREAERFRKLHDDLQEDLAELRQKLTVRNEEYQGAQQALEQTRSDLALARIRIDQLSGTDGEGHEDSNAKIESLTQQNMIKAQQLKDLQEMVKQIGAERDQSNQQYQSYVLHLNKEIANLAEKIVELTNENNKLAKSEEAAVRFANELERQIQQQLQRQQTLTEAARDTASPQDQEQPPHEDAAYKQKLEALQKRCDELERERDALKAGMSTKDEERSNCETLLKQTEEQVALLQLTVERLQLDKPDVAKLLAEIESGKVGASRAVTQNRELKEQLEEMQRAFVQISNDKLNLTDQLQTELHLGKEMKANYGHLETELASIREQLHYKDEEMIRLAHENTELSKQVLQQSQEIDRLRYYESRSNDAVTLQRELETQRHTVEELERQLRSTSPPSDMQQATMNGVEPGDAGSATVAMEDRDAERREIETLRQEKEELLRALNRFQQDRATTGSDPVAEGERAAGGERRSSIVSSIPTQEAMEKLQARFKRTMMEVAELTEERQRLEHLVMQLQGETETIGEYITLYQQQRRMLKQKDMERDLQLQQLADDREMMKLKLKELNYLVHRLVHEQQANGGDADVDHQHYHDHRHISDHGVDCDRSVSAASAAHSGSEHHPTPASEAIANGEVNDALPKVQIKATETAGRILSLLTDIKEANIPYGSGVQHCSCCSGRLETV